MASGDVWILSINTKMMDVPNGQTVVQNVKSGTIVKYMSTFMFTNFSKIYLLYLLGLLLIHTPKLL